MGTASSIVAGAQNAKARPQTAAMPPSKTEWEHSRPSSAPVLLSPSALEMPDLEPHPAAAAAAEETPDAGVVSAFEGLRESAKTLETAHSRQFLRESLRLQQLQEHRSSLGGHPAGHMRLGASFESSNSCLGLEAMLEMSADQSLSGNLSGPGKAHRSSWSSSSIESIATSLMLENMQQPHYPGIGQFSERSFDATGSRSMLDVLGRPSQTRSVRKTQSSMGGFRETQERLSPIEQSPDARGRKRMFRAENVRTPRTDAERDSTPRTLDVTRTSTGGPMSDLSDVQDRRDLFARSSSHSLGDESVHTFHTGASFQLEHNFSPLDRPRSQRYDAANDIAMARLAATRLFLEASSHESESDADSAGPDPLNVTFHRTSGSVGRASQDRGPGRLDLSRPAPHRDSFGRKNNRLLSSAVTRSARNSASAVTRTARHSASARVDQRERESTSHTGSGNSLGSAAHQSQQGPRQATHMPHHEAGGAMHRMAAEPIEKPQNSKQSLSSVAGRTHLVARPQESQRPFQSASGPAATPQEALKRLRASMEHVPMPGSLQRATSLPPIDALLQRRPSRSGKQTSRRSLRSTGSASSQEEPETCTDRTPRLSSGSNSSEPSDGTCTAALPGLSGADTENRLMRPAGSTAGTPEWTRRSHRASARGDRPNVPGTRAPTPPRRAVVSPRALDDARDACKLPVANPASRKETRRSKLKAFTVAAVRPVLGLTVDTGPKKAKASTISVDRSSERSITRTSSSRSLVKRNDVMDFGTNLFEPKLGGADNIDEFGIWRFGASGGEQWSYHDRIVNVRRLGSGASSVVYKGFDLLTQHIVAVKVMRIADKKQRQQFKTELEIFYKPIKESHRRSRRLLECQSMSWTGSVTSELDDVDLLPPGSESVAPEDIDGIKRDRHRLCSQPTRHLVRLLDAFCCSEDNTVSIVMEYMNGGSLQDVVDRGGVQDEAVLASIAFQGLVGLGNLHQLSVIHRDIKPANLLMTNDGTIKISDFGISGVEDGKDGEAAPRRKARRASAGHHVVLADDLNRRKGDGDEAEANAASLAYSQIGTVWYMSPERIHGEEYGYNCDVWALGLSIVTIALGHMPLLTGHTNYWKLRNRLRNDPPPILPEEDARWSPAFRNFIKQMLTKDPAARPSAEQMLFHPFLKQVRTSYLDGHRPEVRSVPTSPFQQNSILEQAAIVHLDEIIDAIISHCEEVKQKPSAKVNPKRMHGHATSTDLSHAMHANKPGQLHDFARQLGLSMDIVTRRFGGMQYLINDIRPAGLEMSGGPDSDDFSLGNGSVLSFHQRGDTFDSMLRDSGSGSGWSPPQHHRTSTRISLQSEAAPPNKPRQEEARTVHARRFSDQFERSASISTVISS